MNIGAPSASAFAQNGSNLGRRQFLAVDAGADRHAAQAEPLHAVFELLGREIGMLQRHRREADESIRVGGAERRQLLVLALDQLRGELAVDRVPERVDAEDLDVDALRVHGAKPLSQRLPVEQQRSSAPWLAAGLLSNSVASGHGAVRVHVHGLDAPALHDDRAPRRASSPSRLRASASPQPTNTMPAAPATSFRNSRRFGM